MLLVIAAASLLGLSAGDDRIVGGSPAEIEEAPWQVALLLDRLGIYSHVCGGSIIYADVILTAARCTSNTTASQLRIRAGSSYHDSGGQIVSVVRYQQHHFYNINKRFDYDISVVHLGSNLVFGANVATIAMPLQGATVEDGAIALVTGWGNFSAEQPGSRQLYKVSIPVVNQLQCEDAIWWLKPYWICGGDMSGGSADFCQGDTGGPMVIDGVLHGISSSHDTILGGCGRPGKPGLYTRVAEFRSWINGITKK